MAAPSLIKPVSGLLDPKKTVATHLTGDLDLSLDSLSRVLDLAADANGIKRKTFPDREFDALAASALGPGSAAVKRKLIDLRRSVPPPWRTDEKQAATAAWLVLHGRLE